MSGSSFPPNQFMGVTPKASSGPEPTPGPMRLSNTDDVLFPALEDAKRKCHSTFMIRSFDIRIWLFHCCGTEGPGTRESICPWACKGCSIRWTANGCSALATCLRAICSCGYFLYKDCDGCLDDQKRLNGRVAPSSN